MLLGTKNTGSFICILGILKLARASIFAYFAPLEFVLSHDSGVFLYA